jgi:hypothetical protein
MNIKKLPLLLILAGLISVSFSACKRTADDKYKTDPSKGYFPVRLGHYVVYNVDSTIWNDFDCTKRTVSFQLRSTIADSFVDNQGRKSYRVENMVRESDTTSWKFYNVNYLTPTSSSIEMVENNLRFIKLTFPIIEGNSWNGNAKIATDDQDLQYFAGWKYKYLNYAKNFSTNNTSYSNTVTVTETDEMQNDPDVTPAAYSYRTYAIEVYGYDYGMVYKELTHWIYDPGVKTCRKGYSVVMKAVDHN